jgi:Spy/CpxP family protein refolding chaperone
MNQQAARALRIVATTEEQRAEINAILDEVATEIYRLRKERKNLRTQVIEALQAERVNHVDLTKIQIASANLFQETSSVMVDAVLDVSEVLSPEQRIEVIKSWRKRQ